MILKKLYHKILKSTYFIMTIIILTINIVSNKACFLNNNIRETSPLTGRLSQLSTADAWMIDGTVICNESNDQLYSQIYSDAMGGAIITWEDKRNGMKSDIYSQRINLKGEIQWNINGVAISTGNYTQGAPQICSDENGGAIITWNDKRNGLDYDIYTQWINSTGSVKWIVNGTAISTADEDQVIPQISSDGAGGAIIIWNDYRSGANYDIYAQKINSTGNVKWSANGTAIVTEGGDQYFPHISSDEAGGAIITWEDSRGSDSDIYAQRVNSTGSVKWGANGSAICTATNTQWYTQICSDGAGGAIITWSDNRSGINYDIYAQWINSTGDVKWGANGTAICTADGDQLVPQIYSDGLGGAIITWEDERSGSNGDIFAQRINSTGSVKWGANGLAISTADGDQISPQICGDGAGGAIIAWEDERSLWNDIYAQKITSSGAIKWTADGVAVCKASYAQRHPQICSGENGSAIITWYDKRNGMDYDIYAQFVEDVPLKGDEGFPFGILITMLSIGGIAIAVIITVFILKKRRKYEQ
jgi:hypothetical protein